MVGKCWTFNEILLQNAGKSGFSDTPGGGGRESKIQHFELKMMDFGPNLEIWLGQISQNVVLGKFYGLGRLCGGQKLDVYRNFA